jgi:hypothetical protein
VVTALTIRPDRHYRLLIGAAGFVIVAGWARAEERVARVALRTGESRWTPAMS